MKKITKITPDLIQNNSVCMTWPLKCKIINFSIIPRQWLYYLFLFLMLLWQFLTGWIQAHVHKSLRWLYQIILNVTMKQYMLALYQESIDNSPNFVLGAVASFYFTVSEPIMFWSWCKIQKNWCTVTVAPTICLFCLFSLLTYGVYIAQLIRYSRACSSYECFILRAVRLSI